jgi:hypothetical protein
MPSKKENYNFAKIGAILANYGYNCIKLADDWNGADFIALHLNGEDLKVQLKGRVTINKKYLGKNLYIAFPHRGEWYVYPHDPLVDYVESNTNWLRTTSWTENGFYHAGTLSKNLKSFLDSYRL